MLWDLGRKAPEIKVLSNASDSWGCGAVCGNSWLGNIFQFNVDNKAVADIVNSTSSKDTHLMHLTRLVVILAAYFNFWFMARHVEGKKNTLADALSRN